METPPVTDETLKEMGLNVEDAKLPDTNGVAPVDVIAVLQERANMTKHRLEGKQGAALSEAMTDEVSPDKDRIVLEHSEINGPHVKPVMASTVWTELVGEDIGTVELTDEDKDRYFRHMLHDEPFTFVITQGMDDKRFEVEIRSLNVGEAEVAFAAATEDARKANDLFPSETGMSFFNNYVGFLQKYLAAAQIVRVVNKSLQPFTWSGSILELEQKNKAMADIRRAKSESVDTWSEPKWTLIFKALRIFEAKMKLCKEGMANGNF